MKEEERLKKEKQDMLGFYDYTVVLTYISLVISVFGMTRALAGDFKVAILCLALSGLCDMFDGKIARTKKDRTEDEKKFGIQIDSLCDMVCFGAFPILLAYSLGMRGPIGIVILAWYGMNGVVRLGYFNVCETKRQEETEEVRKYYSGLPITSIAVVLPLVFVLHTVLRNHFAVALHVAMFVVGTLFVTNIQVKKPRNSTLAVLVGVVALAILKIFHIF